MHLKCIKYVARSESVQQLYSAAHNSYLQQVQNSPPWETL